MYILIKKSIKYSKSNTYIDQGAEMFFGIDNKM